MLHTPWDLIFRDLKALWDVLIQVQQEANSLRVSSHNAAHRLILLTRHTLHFANQDGKQNGGGGCLLVVPHALVGARQHNQHSTHQFFHVIIATDMFRVEKDLWYSSSSRSLLHFIAALWILF